MKTFIYLYFALVCIGTAAPPNEFDTLKEQLKNLKAAALTRQIDYINYPELLKSVPEYNALGTQIEAHWKVLLNNLESVAATDAEKHLFFDSLELLPPKTYIEALRELVVLRKAGTLSDTWLTRALFPQMQMSLILVDNYRDSSVIALLQSIKTIPDLDQKLSDSIDDVLNGEAKKTFDDMREFENLPTANLIQNQVVEASIRPARQGESVGLRTFKNLWIQSWGFFLVALTAIIIAAVFLVRRKKHRKYAEKDTEIPHNPLA